MLNPVMPALQRNIRERSQEGKQAVLFLKKKNQKNFHPFEARIAAPVRPPRSPEPAAATSAMPSPATHSPATPTRQPDPHPKAAAPT
jgi:hypothetical protein